MKKINSGGEREMKKSRAEYKKMKTLKQKIKSTPEKETDKPLLKSTVKMKTDPYGIDMLGFMWPILAKSALRGQRHNINK